MGIHTTYRRVPALLLEQWRATQNEPAAKHYIGQDVKQFPYSIQHLLLQNNIDLHGLLNPDSNTKTILWHVVEGATALDRSNYLSEEIYLGQVYYLTPDQVRAIANELAQLDFDTLVHNFASSMDLADHKPQTAFQHPMFIQTYRQFEHVLCFFQIAAEAGEGVVRITS